MKKQILTILMAAVLCLAMACSVYAAIDDIYVGDSNGKLSLVNGSTLNTITSETGFGSVTALGYQSNGNVVVGNAAGSLYLRNGMSLSGITTEGGFGAIKDLVVESNNNILVGSDGYGGSLWRRDGSTLAGMGDLSGFGTITSLAALTNGNVAVGTAEGNVFMRSSDLSWIDAGNYGYVRAMAALQNGNLVIASDSWGGILWLKGPSLQTINDTSGFGTMTDLAVRPDGNFVVGSSSFAGGTGFLMSPALGVLGSNTGLGSVTAFAVQSDGDIVFGTSDGNLIMLDSVTLGGKVVKAGFGGPITSLAVQTTNAVPEPGSIVALCSGLIGMVGFSIRRRRA